MTDPTPLDLQPVPEGKRCLRCSTEFSREHRQRRRDAGLCQTCGLRPAEDGLDCASCREVKRGRRLKRTYGIEPALADAKMNAQRHRCAICGSAFEGVNGGASPKLDHGHRTGAVRGFLCSVCNVALGHIEAVRKPEGWIESVQAYLARHANG